MIGDKELECLEIFKRTTTGGCSRKHYMWTPVLSPYHTFHEFVSLEVHFFRESLLSLDEASHICIFLIQLCPADWLSKLGLCGTGFLPNSSGLHYVGHLSQTFCWWSIALGRRSCTDRSRYKLGLFRQHPIKRAARYRGGVRRKLWLHCDGRPFTRTEFVALVASNLGNHQATSFHLLLLLDDISPHDLSTPMCIYVLKIHKDPTLLTDHLMQQPSRKSAPCPTCCRAMETMRVVASEKQQQLSLKFCQDCWQFATRLWHHPNYHPYHPFRLDLPVPWMWISHVFYWL